MSSKLLPPYKHQSEDVDFELKHEVVFDTSDPGTGKTRTRLMTYAKRRASGCKCALVIGPKSILKAAWANDVKKFTPWLTYSIAYAENRAEAFDAKVDIYITNHDAAKWLAKQTPKFFAKFDVLIVDESGAYKHHTSQRSKALNKIKKYFKYRICQNGTPNPNTITDVWNQVNILDDGKRLGASFYAFRAATQEPEQVGPRPNMVKWSDREGSDKAVGSLIDDITIRHIFEDCHDIPKNHNYVIPFELSPKLQIAYDAMEKDAILKLKTGEITAINAATVVTKLLQIASGAVYDSEAVHHLVDTSRYELIGDLCEARKFSVVFFLWKHQKEQLIKEFNSRKLTYTVIDGSTSRKAKDDAEAHFQAGFYRVLLTHPQSAAHGYTFTKGTSTIWPSPTYNLEHWLQGNRRIYRAGQTEKTETINVVAENTLEERVYHVLTQKNVKLMDLLEVLRK